MNIPWLPFVTKFPVTQFKQGWLSSSFPHPLLSQVFAFLLSPLSSPFCPWSTCSPPPSPSGSSWADNLWPTSRITPWERCRPPFPWVAFTPPVQSLPRPLEGMFAPLFKPPSRRLNWQAAPTRHMRAHVNCCEMTLFPLSVVLCPFPPPPTSAFVPLQDLMDRLIALNSDAKMNSLFHFEQSHTFGLRYGDFFSLSPLLLYLEAGKRTVGLN